MFKTGTRDCDSTAARLPCDFSTSNESRSKVVRKARGVELQSRCSRSRSRVARWQPLHTALPSTFTVISTATGGNCSGQCTNPSQILHERDVTTTVHQCPGIWCESATICLCDYPSHSTPRVAVLWCTCIYNRGLRR